MIFEQRRDTSDILYKYICVYHTRNLYYRLVKKTQMKFESTGIEMGSKDVFLLDCFNSYVKFANYHV